MGSQSSNFRRISDNKEVDISTLTDNEKETLYYKDEPYTTAKLHQRLIVTYSPKYAAYQKQVRQKQIDRATKMVEKNAVKKQRKNPNDPARFISKTAVTEDGYLFQNVKSCQPLIYFKRSQLFGNPIILQIFPIGIDLNDSDRSSSRASIWF